MSLLGHMARSVRMPPGATNVGAREDYELRDGASPLALERCAISAVLRGCLSDVDQGKGRPYLDILRTGSLLPGGARGHGCFMRRCVVAWGEGAGQP